MSDQDSARTPLLNPQPPYQASPPPPAGGQYYQTYPQHTQTTIVTSNTDDDRHILFAVIIFIVGFFFPIVWIGGYFFLRSRSSSARVLGVLSVVFFSIGFVFIIIIISIWAAGVFALTSTSCALEAFSCETCMSAGCNWCPDTGLCQHSTSECSNANQCETCTIWTMCSSCIGEGCSWCPSTQSCVVTGSISCSAPETMCCDAQYSCNNCLEDSACAWCGTAQNSGNCQLANDPCVNQQKWTGFDNCPASATNSSLN